MPGLNWAFDLNELIVDKPLGDSWSKAPSLKLIKKRVALKTPEMCDESKGGWGVREKRHDVK